MDNSILRRVQLTQLEIAKEIKRICEELKINYFLDSGTLLGAVRHGGFIPWDDDLDLGMLRSDYELFIKNAPDLLDKKYYLQTWETDQEYGLAFTKIRKKNTIYREEAAEKNKANCGIWIDIFPYDVFPDSKRMQKWQGRRYYLYRRLLTAKYGYKPWVMSEKNKMVKKIAYGLLKLYAKRYTKQQLIDKYLNACTKFNGEGSRYYYEQAGSAGYGKWIIPRECFDVYIEMKFEDTYFKVPAKYDLYLKSVYGDYMKLPPKEKRNNRHKIIEVVL